MVVKTNEGLEVEVIEDAFNDMEALDALVEMDAGSPIALSKVTNMLLTAESKKKLYDFYRDESGKVRLETFVPVIVDIMTKMNQETKN